MFIRGLTKSLLKLILLLHLETSARDLFNLKLVRDHAIVFMLGLLNIFIQNLRRILTILDNRTPSFAIELKLVGKAWLRAIHQCRT